MACNLKVILLNVRAIRNQNKRRAIFCYLKQQKATIFGLQETYSQPDDEKIWSAEWGRKVFFCHGTVHAFNFGPNLKRWITIFYKGVQLVQL